MQFEFHDQRITINIASRSALIQAVRGHFARGDGFALATVNLDHLVKMRQSADFARAYAAQDLVVADGWPIAALSRLAGKPVTRAPGADLVVPLCQLAAEMGRPVALVGSTQDALVAARDALVARVPGLNVARVVAPPMGFDPASAAAGELLGSLSDSGIALCFLALGAPKQEVFAARGRIEAPSVGFASIGAGLDFLSGRQRRAPRWMRKAGLEWLWRALSSPKRLGPRYARCIAILPGQIRRALTQRG